MSVHRNGIPPRRSSDRVILSMSDMDFNEDALVQWCRDNLTGWVQYDYTVFNGTKGKLNRDVEVKLWFQNKTDGDEFRAHWCE